MAFSQRLRKFSRKHFDQCIVPACKDGQPIINLHVQLHFLQVVRETPSKATRTFTFVLCQHVLQKTPGRQVILFYFLNFIFFKIGVGHQNFNFIYAKIQLLLKPYIPTLRPKCSQSYWRYLQQIMQNTQSATAACVATQAAVAVFHQVESNLLKKRSHSQLSLVVCSSAVGTQTIILMPQGASSTFCR